MQQTITLRDRKGNTYPVGGCYMTKEGRLEGESVAYVVIVSPSGGRTWRIAKTKQYYDAKPTPDMIELRDVINAALLNPEIDTLDLSEVAQSVADTIVGKPDPD